MYEYRNANDVNLMDVGKADCCQTTTTHNKARNLYIILGIYCMKTQDPQFPPVHFTLASGQFGKDKPGDFDTRTTQKV